MSRGQPKNTRKSTSSPTPDSPGARRLLVIGEPPRLARVVRKLVALTTDIQTEVWSPELEIGEDPGVVGVVLVGPVRRTGLPAAVRRLAAQLTSRSVPIFVVAPDGSDDRSVRALYCAGATAVLLWPSEARHVGSLVAEIMAASLVHGTPSSEDEALARIVRARLRAQLPIPPALRIEARRGVVELSGHVDTLPRKRQIVETVARIRGVKGALDGALVVAPSGRSDRAVARDVRAVLKAVSDVADDTLTITVRNGYVNVAGAIADRREMDRLLDVLANVRGVRGIHNYTTISPVQKANDRALTRRLEQLLEARFPRESVAATAFGRVAVLSGRVGRLAAKREIERMVLAVPAIERVVNKVTVT